MYIHTNVRTCIHTYTHNTYLHTYLYTHSTHLRTYVYIHTYMIHTWYIHTQTVIDTTQKETAIDQQKHRCETLICQSHRTILRLLSSAATASTRWRVRELYCPFTLVTWRRRHAGCAVFDLAQEPAIALSSSWTSRNLQHILYAYRKHHIMCIQYSALCLLSF